MVPSDVLDYELAKIAGAKNVLWSYYRVLEKFGEEKFVRFLQQAKKDGINIMIDSGAPSLRYSEDSDGYFVKYVDFLKSNLDLIDNWVALDYIYDPDRTDKNADKMISEIGGEKAIVVYHAWRPISVFEDYLRKYDYVGIGGWVNIGEKKSRKIADSDAKYGADFSALQKEKFLDLVWQKVIDSGKKIHLFGVNSSRIVLKYRPFSCDASTFVKYGAYNYVYCLSGDEEKILKQDYVGRDIDRSVPRSFYSLDNFFVLVSDKVMNKIDCYDLAYSSVARRYINLKYLVFLEELANSQELYELYQSIVRKSSIDAGFLRSLGNYLYSMTSNYEVKSNTPYRFINALNEFLVGYKYNPYEVAKTFEFGEVSGVSNEVVKVRLGFVSLCEHHLLPFWGSVEIEYLPDSKILGLSKFSRIVEILSRRLQLQERLTAEIYSVLNDILCPRYLKVKVKARHLCSIARGVKKNSVMETEVSSVGNESG